VTKASEHVLVAKLGSARRRELQDIKSAPAFKSCPRPRLAEPVFAVQSIARRYNAEPKISAGEQDGRARQSREAIEKGHPNLERCWVTGPTLRKILNISSVTLWRWRHRQHSEFRSAKSINSRLYFYWPDVQAWLDKQTDAA
jgi:hypothetical protein